MNSIEIYFEDVKDRNIFSKDMTFIERLNYLDIFMIEMLKLDPTAYNISMTKFLQEEIINELEIFICDKGFNCEIRNVFPRNGNSTIIIIIKKRG